MAGRSGAEIARLFGLFLFLALLVWLSHPQPWSVAAGAPLVVLGEAVRLWAGGHLHKTEKLITSGPYRYTRNPMYLGRFLLLTGIALMAWFPYGANIVVLLIGWAVFFGYYMRRKERIEPARLLAVHGEPYRVYNAAVPALFPTLKPFPDNGERWLKERHARNREGLTAVFMAVVIVVFALRAFQVIS